MAALALEILYRNLILKPFAACIRPCDINTAVRLLVPRPGLAALIGFSRLYLYIYFPTDVLAGAVLGALLGCLSYALVSWAGNHHMAQKGRK